MKARQTRDEHLRRIHEVADAADRPVNTLIDRLGYASFELYRRIRGRSNRVDIPFVWSAPRSEENHARQILAWLASVQTSRTHEEDEMDFEFTLIVAGDLTDEAVVDALFEAGCDDASIGMVDGVGIVSFLRDDLTFKEAVLSAIVQVESVAGIHVRRVEPDDILAMAEIAERLDRSRESIRLLVRRCQGRRNVRSAGVTRANARATLAMVGGRGLGRRDHA